jgi:phosphatidylglycerophosphatase A
VSTGAPRGAQPSFFVRFVATGFFSGYSPWASGTVGTVVGALFFFIPYFSHPLVLAPAIGLALVVGAYTARQVAAVEGHRLTKSAQKAKALFQPGDHPSPDPSVVVIDEIVGMWIAMFALYPTFMHPPLIAVVVGFVTFRAFDIVKPYPARELERLGSGWGIMLDDVVAGVYANIATRILLALLFSIFPALF